ncbi:glycoside hydrolase family 79 [Trichoderma reesei QM6a]|uniref:alpha-1,2-Mannosidase n=1 Tax=Hypocrea jecorina (strain QM6a) TaxID=431241 RepID=G0RID6_HYPJQ|nr:glycoside hydrolase family 79 [Trichoderma reesei QM6a]EGR49218.1 glycoside hydrolase family 79 [Trichoderma reesei QM6a]
MARRRYRLFMICAAVILFLLYRVSQNTWDDSAHYATLRHPPASNPPAAGGESPLKPAAKPEHEHEHENGYAPESKPKPQSEPKPESKPAPEHAAGGQKSQGKPSYEDDEETGKNPPKSAVIPSDTRLPPDNKVHWRPVKEHFPVPSESVISLPTGKPLKVPRVQHEFGVESPEAKSRRVARQERVGKEIERAWSGYKKFAWMHDELSPVSAKHRDPFCGWAATLVDSLDTLWIAGLKEQFDEAARAVEQIDFTTTPRNNIPVFETTIRYLGGLLGAFDVSGGHDGGYPMLLTKAVELAEILMGIFDTPNRMPILYYQWQPEYASQPHRAGSVGIAELGTLSMEFTRLAQLTSQYKYYDAVDRITDALIELQKQGTSIPGLFPENLDASGCNHTATALRSSLSEAAQKQMDEDLSNKPENYRPGKNSKADPQTVEKQPAKKQNEPVEKAKQVPTQQTAKRGKPPFGANGFTANWDCVPQGLVVGGYGFQQYHMGGGQDSAYEYFPKEYLLLGGLESKYQKLYVDAVEAINEWLLYRPMTDGDWDILFPAKVSTAGNPSQDLVATFEVTHLTCFIGGMYGLGGKIFGREKDLETAKRLTDGCVWAYQSTVSGIMPEGSQVLACPTLEKCDFNETLWWEKLDPAKDWRDKQVADDKDKATVGEALKETANSHDAAGGSKAVHKRAAVPLPKPGADDDVGSELPQSLKDKIGFKNGEQKKPTGSSVGIQRDPDAPVDSVLEAHRLPPQEPEEQQVILPDKPQTHEEFVKQRIAEMGFAPGVVHIQSRQYILRPEAIESVWYMYRITGDPIWMEKGWKMFEATIRATRTEIANSAIDDVNSEEPGLKDEMESFWLAETLKYYYLLFSEPSVISLDEWVLNTEAHPFKRPGGSVIGHSI